MPSSGRHVTMLTEGTYPHVHGGVSTWCDQLVRGMPEVDFEILALTGSGREPVTWELPPNVTRHTAYPLWGLPQGPAAPGLFAGARRPCGGATAAASSTPTNASCSPSSTPRRAATSAPACTNSPNSPGREG